MKSKFLIWTIGAMALCLMSACANGDVQRVQKAEELLTVNRDSAMAILREVVRPDQLPEESKALYWFCVADIRANTMQSLSEDSMICWAAQYFCNRWLQDGEYKDYRVAEKRQAKTAEIYLSLRYPYSIPIVKMN